MDINGPYTLTWGGVTIVNIQTIEPDVQTNIIEKELVNGTTKYIEGNKKLGFSFQMIASDVAQLAVPLADMAVADGATMVDGTTVATTDTNGVIEFANQCSAAVTTGVLVLNDCTGQPRFTINDGRMIFESYSLEDNTDVVTVKCVSTAATTLGFIGQQ